MATVLDAAAASEFDFIIGLDASGSMGSPSKRFPGKSRWEEAQESITQVAREVTKFDADGIDVVVFGPGCTVEEGVTGETVANVFNSRGPRGSTPTHDAVQFAIDKQRATGKKTVMIIYTDGQADLPNEVASRIIAAANSLSSDDQLTFLFVQVGDDPAATAYLKTLDDNLNAKFDIVDTVKADEADQYDALALIAMAIDG